MVTQQQAIDWLKAQNGKALDFDGVYGCQCADYFNYYYQFLTGGANPIADFNWYEGAKDLWQANCNFDLIGDSESLHPLPGDVFIYGPTWGGGYGHVDMCLFSDDNGSYYSGQNENAQPYNTCVTEGYRTWGQQWGLLGVMRPRFTVEAPEVPTPPTPEPTPIVPPVEPPVVVPEPITPPVEPTPPVVAPVDPPTQKMPSNHVVIVPRPEEFPVPPSTAKPPKKFWLIVLIALIKKLFKKKG